MTMTLEQAIKMGDEVNYRAPEARHGYAEAARLLADALAAEKRRADEAEARLRTSESRRWTQCTSVSNECLGGCASMKEHDLYVQRELNKTIARITRERDEAHAAGFREAVEQAVKVAEAQASETDRIVKNEYGGCMLVYRRDAERNIAAMIRALAPAAPTAAAPVPNGQPNGQPARPRHYADCAHDSTAEISVPHMDERCGFVSEVNHVACTLPVGHAGWHRNPPVPAPAECACYRGCHDGDDLHQHADDPCPAHPTRPMAPAETPAPIWTGGTVTALKELAAELGATAPTTDPDGNNYKSVLRECAQKVRDLKRPAETPAHPAFDAEAALVELLRLCDDAHPKSRTLRADDLAAGLEAALAAGRKP